VRDLKSRPQNRKTKNEKNSKKTAVKFVTHGRRTVGRCTINPGWGSGRERNDNEVKTNQTPTNNQPTNHTQSNIITLGDLSVSLFVHAAIFQNC
jgi:hypothetical protein